MSSIKYKLVQTIHKQYVILIADQQTCCEFISYFLERKPISPWIVRLLTCLFDG